MRRFRAPRAATALAVAAVLTLAAPAQAAPQATASGFQVTALYCSGLYGVLGTDGYWDNVQACIQKGTLNGIPALRPYIRAWVNIHNDQGTYCVTSLFYRNDVIIGDNSDDVRCKTMSGGAGVNFEDDIYGDVAGIQTYQEYGGFQELVPKASATINS